ncbi:MAG: hypothetical protein Q9187_002413 [Circinaria calcarea]
MTSSCEITDREVAGKLPVQYSRKMIKESNESCAENTDGIEDGDAEPRRRGFTVNDRRDMQRMGRRQELMVGRVDHHRKDCHLSVFFTSANTQGLVDGGLAGLFWSYIWTFVGFGIVIASLAEMASMLVKRPLQHSLLSNRYLPGLLFLVDNTIGSRSSHRRDIRNS